MVLSHHLLLPSSLTITGKVQEIHIKELVSFKHLTDLKPFISLHPCKKEHNLMYLSGIGWK